MHRTDNKKRDLTSSNTFVLAPARLSWRSQEMDQCADFSGDREEPVRRLATLVGVSYQSEFGPGEKAAHIAALAKSGRKPLMVGDGLNDAPALGAAHASMAPASAADVGRNAADLVFLHDDLCAIPFAVQAACETAKLLHQTFGLAVIYNVMAIPIAILGYVTPLIWQRGDVHVVDNRCRQRLRLSIRSKTEGRDIIERGVRPIPAPLAGAKIASRVLLPYSDRIGARHRRTGGLHVVAPKRAI